MNKYHKIQTVFKRDPETKNRTLLMGEYSEPEFKYLQNNVWVFTEKIDGTNIRIMFDGNSIRFAGKESKTMLPASLLGELNEWFMPELKKFKKIFPDGSACLYGEGCGKGIQKHGERYYEHQGFVLFDVNVGGWWLRRDDMLDVSSKLGINFVPVVAKGTLDDMVSLVSEGFRSAWGDFTAEGIVARPEAELFSRKGERIVVKLKHKDFAEVK